MNNGEEFLHYSGKSDSHYTITYFEYPKFVRVYSKKEELQEIEDIYLYERKVGADSDFL